MIERKHHTLRPPTTPHELLERSIPISPDKVLNLAYLVLTERQRRKFEEYFTTQRTTGGKVRLIPKSGYRETLRNATGEDQKILTTVAEKLWQRYSPSDY